MKQIIDNLAKELKDLEITYSMSTYLLAMLVDKGVITVDEIKGKIKGVEDLIPVGNDLTDDKSKNKLSRIKRQVEEHTDIKVLEIRKDIVNKMHVLNVIFDNNKYVTIPSYIDNLKMSEVIKKIIVEV